MYLISFVCEDTRVSATLVAGVAGTAEAQDRYWREMIAQTRKIGFQKLCGPFFFHRRFERGRMRRSSLDLHREGGEVLVAGKDLTLRMVGNAPMVPNEAQSKFKTRITYGGGRTQSTKIIRRLQGKDRKVTFATDEMVSHFRTSRPPVPFVRIYIKASSTRHKKRDFALFSTRGSQSINPR